MDGGKRVCTCCGKGKAPAAFYWLPGNGKSPRSPRWSSWCRACVRRGETERRMTEDYRAWLKEYLSRPDVQERRRQADRKRIDKRRAQKKAYNATARGRLMHCRRQARIDLAAATSEKRRQRLEDLIASYTREIERMNCLEGRNAS